MLEQYGDDVDYNGESSRVLFSARLPNHRLVCKPSKVDGIVYDFLNDQKLDVSKDDVIIGRFVCISKVGWYYELPPFDKILGEYDGESVVLDFSSINIQLKRIVRE